MAEEFIDNRLYGFFIYAIMTGTWKTNPGIKMVFACIDNNLDVYEIMSVKEPLKGSKVHKLAKALGFKEDAGKELDPITFFRRGARFSAKVVKQFSEGKLETARYRINFETLKPYTKASGNIDDTMTKWVKDYVGDIKTKSGVVTKLRNTNPFPNFEQLAALGDMIQNGELELQ